MRVPAAALIACFLSLPAWGTTPRPFGCNSQITLEGATAFFSCRTDCEGIVDRTESDPSVSGFFHATIGLSDDCGDSRSVREQRCTNTYHVEESCEGDTAQLFIYAPMTMFALSIGLEDQFGNCGTPNSANIVGQTQSNYAFRFSTAVHYHVDVTAGPGTVFCSLTNSSGNQQIMDVSGTGLGDGVWSGELPYHNCAGVCLSGPSEGISCNADTDCNGSWGFMCNIFGGAGHNASNEACGEIASFYPSKVPGAVIARLDFTPIDVSSDLLTIRFDTADTASWIALDNETWNLYRGDLEVLRDTGVYTQSTGAQFCDLPSPDLVDTHEPEPGKVSFYLGTRRVGSQEASLGTDSDDLERPNANPCP